MRRAACGGFCLLILGGAGPLLFAQPADSGWPMFRHDLQGTNRADVAGPAEGQIDWSIDTPAGDHFGLYAVGPDGVIYGSAGTAVYALDPSDGGTLWSVSQPGYLPGGSIVEQDGNVLTFWREDTSATAKSGRICQIGPTGDVLDTAPLANAISCPTVGDDGTVYGRRDGLPASEIVAVNRDGSVRWAVGGPDSHENTQIYGGVCRQISMGHDGHLYVACGYSNHLVSVNVSTGTVRWESTAMYGGLFCIGQDGLIYVGSDRGVRCVHPDSGVQIWQRKVIDDLRSISMFSNGNVLAWREWPSGTAAVYCYEPDSDIAWQFDIPRPAWFSMPIVTDAAGRAYLYNDELLVALDSDGTHVWHLEFLQSDVHDMIIGPDGTLYLSHDEHLTAISDAFLPGDANRDGRVNIFDAFMLKAAWGTREGDPSFDPDCDFNHDGAVSIFDAFILDENWQGPLGGGSASVPEPATVLLTVLGAAALAASRRGIRRDGKCTPSASP